MRTRVSAIVVSYNNRGDIAACLDSLLASTCVPDEIILVDNNSRDGTADFVRRKFPHVTVLDYWDNPGFGEANNRAFRIVTGDYCFLLNPDATTSADALSHLIRELEQSPEVGVAVPKVVLASEPSIINSAGLSVNRLGYACDRGYLEWDHGQYDTPGPVLAGSGCAMLLRSSLLARLGGFDPMYFLYYEDLDLCLRSWLAGFAVHYVPRAVVRHSMKVSGRSEVYNHYLDHRNRLRTVLKTWSLSALLGTLPRAIAFDVESIARLILTGQRQAATLRLKAWGWNAVHLVSTLRHRRSIQAGRVRSHRVLAELQTDGHGSPRLDAALPDYAELYDDSARTSPLDRELCMGRNDIGLLGLGWYGRETSEGTMYRWSCGYGIVFLRRPGPARPGRMIITCRSAVPNRVIVRCNRRNQGEFAVAAGPWTEYSVATDLDSEAVRIELLPQNVIVPADTLPGSPDCRRLGVAVSRIELR